VGGGSAGLGWFGGSSMRIELYDYVNYSHVIDTEDLELVARWLAGKCSKLITANVALGPVRMNIWPTTDEENDRIGGRVGIELTQDGLLAMAQVFLDASKRLADEVNGDVPVPGV
jgi:hypothetical protein